MRLRNFPLKNFEFKLGTRLSVYIFAVLSVIYLFEAKSNLNTEIENRFYDLVSVLKPDNSGFEQDRLKFPSDLFDSKNSKISTADLKKSLYEFAKA